MVISGPTNGTGQILTPNGSQYVSGGNVTLMGGVTSPVRVSSFDVNGDGTSDVIVAAGPGGPPRVVVIDGRTQGTLADFLAFEASFTGGLFVSGGDFNRDGRADVVVTPDRGGGPRTIVYDGKTLTGGTNSPGKLSDFFGLADLQGQTDDSFRGGVRPAVADVTGDGVPDLIVAAGFLGGPRVTVWDGRGVAAAGGGKSPLNPVANFFAFEDSLRNGAFVTSGEVTGDGKAEIVVAGGPGGGPRIRIMDGTDLLAAGNFRLDDRLDVEFGNFFAGNPDTRGGIRVAMRDMDGDGVGDLVTGSGEGQPSEVRVYRGTTLRASPMNPAPDQTLDPFGGSLMDGVYVG